MVGSVLIALQASFNDGRGVSTSDFLAPLKIDEQDEIESTRANGGAWASGLVTFPIARLSTFAKEDEPHEALAAEVRRALLMAAAFLNRRPKEAIADLRRNGLSLRMFIDVWMNQD